MSKKNSQAEKVLKVLYKQLSGKLTEEEKNRDTKNISDEIYKLNKLKTDGVITEEEYEEFKKKMPESVNWSELLAQFETSDMTEGAQELACVAGNCEI